MMNKPRDEANPVLLLTGAVWHIVENSRRSTTALCGRAIHERRAHARLSNVGEEKVCRDCWKLWQAGIGN